jgi:hypothetical protein
MNLSKCYITGVCLNFGRNALEQLRLNLRKYSDCEEIKSNALLYIFMSCDSLLCEQHEQRSQIFSKNCVVIFVLQWRLWRKKYHRGMLWYLLPDFTSNCQPIYIAYLHEIVSSISDVGSEADPGTKRAIF